MIKLTYEQVSSQGFVMGIQKLVSTPMHTRLAYAIKKLVVDLNKARKQVTDDYQKDIVDKYAQKDAEGKLVHPEGNPAAFDVMPDQKEAFEKDQADFGKREIKIDRYKLTLQDFVDNNIKLSARELTDLEPIYEGEPDVTPENVTAIR